MLEPRMIKKKQFKNKEMSIILKSSQRVCRCHITRGVRKHLGNSPPPQTPGVTHFPTLRFRSKPLRNFYI